jgi:hypothetical protein
MGCDYYYLEPEDSSAFIHFAIDDDTFSCLCTFPYNYPDQKLDRDTIRSLALLGAAVVLANHKELELPIFLPNNIPQWIIDGINKYLLEDKE